jgi:hypothetical protein
LFRGKFLAALTGLYRRGCLTLAGRLHELADARQFGRWVSELRATDWVVYAKPPFGGPDQVLKYLARYTHRVAIANHRLVGLDNRTVSFRWKDYADSSAVKVMTLDGVEFVRRFPQHVLPTGFVRIRHYGLLANRDREEKLARCRALLAASAPPPPTPPPAPDVPVTPVPESGGDAPPESTWRCPACATGRMIVVETVTRTWAGGHPFRAMGADSS